MGYPTICLLLLFGLSVTVLAYIRLAPSDPNIWHVMPKAATDKDFKTGVLRVRSAGPQTLAHLDQVILQTPRTVVLAGSVSDQMVTYVTRTRVFGFPDYTTIHQKGGVVSLTARSRFGGSDFGVNRDRVDRWLRDLEPGR